MKENTVKNDQNAIAWLETLFALFAWEAYEASGGWGDYVDQFPTVQKAKNFAKKLAERNYQQYNIVDLRTLTKVFPRE